MALTAIVVVLLIYRKAFGFLKMQVSLTTAIMVVLLIYRKALGLSLNNYGLQLYCNQHPALCAALFISQWSGSASVTAISLLVTVEMLVK